MCSLRLRVAFAAHLLAVVSAIGVTLIARASDEESPAWNDPSLLAAAGVEPRWRDLIPSVEDPDRPCIVASPSPAETRSCEEWVKRVLNPSVVTANFRSHLVALRRWPKRDGQDIFVVWYRAAGRLIHIVESNAEITVSSAPLGRAAVLTDRQKHLDLVLDTAKAVLDAKMLPHPLWHPRIRSEAQATTSGSWRPAALDIARDAKGRFMMRVPQKPTIQLVRFMSDGRVVRFELLKGMPGAAGFPDPFKARFGGSSSGQR